MPSEPARDGASDPAFATYYLQRSTQELSEDLEKVRNADDFKADSVPFLVHALQQGAGQFSSTGKRGQAEPGAQGRGQDRK